MFSVEPMSLEESHLITMLKVTLAMGRKYARLISIPSMEAKAYTSPVDLTTSTRAGISVQEKRQ
jgi:hypothetical protein